MDRASSPWHIDRTAATRLAVFSGNLLIETGDDRHYWALTLIAFNLFEMVGIGDSAQERFVAGYEEIVGHRRDTSLIHGWHEGCVARAIRNLFVHGLQTEQRQRKNYAPGETAQVHGVALIADSQLQDPPDLYHVELLEGGSYGIRFSPSEIWYYVRQWYEHRRPE
ncbi:MAG: hypothetical protein OXN88_00670 [Chloroflexota bacterium]|nr:hypothetical protein [Chloroflexota bacterium]